MQRQCDHNRTKYFCAAALSIMDTIFAPTYAFTICHHDNAEGQSPGDVQRSNDEYDC
jgi:hypothetical protein